MTEINVSYLAEVRIEIELQGAPDDGKSAMPEGTVLMEL